jgi:hypothetical protein
VLPEPDSELGALKNASLPALGSLHAWMPLKAHVSTVVRVIAVTWEDGNFFVKAIDLRNPSRTTRKPLDVWISNTISLDERAARDAEQTLDFTHSGRP